MFIDTRNKAIEMSKETMKPTFEIFCKGLTNEKDRLIASPQLSNSKALMTHSKKNFYRSSNKNSKPHNLKDQHLLMVMLLIWFLIKRKCILLVSIVEKITTFKRFTLNEDVNL